MIRIEIRTTIQCDNCKDTTKEIYNEYRSIRFNESSPYIKGEQLLHNIKQGSLDDGWELIDGEYICEYCLVGE